MGFGEAVKSFYKRYVDFQGRSSRSEYWWVQLFIILVMVVLGGIGVALGGGMEAISAAAEGGGAMSPVASIMFLLIGIFALVNLIPGIALVVRRLHDLDKSGWWYLLVAVLSMIPLVGLIVSIGFLVFMCIRGTVGPNRFGMDPLGGSAAAFD